MKQPDKAKSVSFNTNERVQSASDCAYLCYSHSNCHEAGFVPGNNQTGTSAQCLFSSDNSSECSANNEAKSTTYDGSTPIVLECITCPATLGSTQVTGQPKIDQTAETRVAGESSEAATTASTGLSFKLNIKGNEID